MKLDTNAIISII